MRKLVANAGLGLLIAAFAVACLVCSPVLLFNFGVNRVRDGIESRWPDSYRARAVSFWIGLLAPLVLCVVLLIAVVISVSGIRQLRLHGAGE